MSKKGLSFDQKKDALLKAMLDSVNIHNMLEIESVGKRNKIIPQSIKEVLEALLAERSISMEKVGTQNIYWAFPSERKASLLVDKAALLAEAEAVRIQRSKAEEALAASIKGVAMNATNRSEILAEIEILPIQIQSNTRELSRLKITDPETVAANLTSARDYCNLWTDNIFILKNRLREFLGLSPDFVDNHFGIPEGFDYYSTYS